MKRRTFIGTSVAATLAAKTAFAGGMPKMVRPIGVQLYTVRDAMKSDFEGTVAKVAATGYKEVEFAGYFNKSPKDIRAILDKNGLAAPSCHVPYSTLEKSWPEALEAANVIGHKLIVNPWIEVEQRNSADGWKKAAELFNKCGESAKKAGIQFAYHNHTFEFQQANGLDGKLPYDYLLANCDKNLVKMELDLCWITVAGKDPIKYFNENPGRFPAVHVKDIKQLPKPEDAPTAGPDRQMGFLTDVGSGVIPWKDIFANAGKAGIQHYFVEHDQPKSPFDSLRNSFQYLEKLRF